MVHHGKKTSGSELACWHEYSHGGTLAMVENRLASMEAEANIVLLDRCVEGNANLVNILIFIRLLPAN